ncbi:MAG: hypothetical protein ACPG7F_06165 [Aggregatilineales bacterium]
MMADKPDFESLFLQAYNMLSKRFADIEFNTPEYEETDKFLTAHRDIFHNAAEVELPYGRCPVCSESCQPEYMPGEDGLEHNQCDDCRITWLIVHTEETKKSQSWESVWLVQDIELF